MDINTIKNTFKKNKIILEKNFPDLDDSKIEKLIEEIMCTNIIQDFLGVKNWYEDIQKKDSNNVLEIDLAKIDKWFSSEENISHKTNKFFQVIGIRTVGGVDRESESGWDQPFFKEINNDGGILGLIKTHINDLPHYLVQAKFEPGNYGKIQISPTLQATFSNIDREHGGRIPYYYEFFEDWESTNKDYLFNSWLAEDGGRFYLKRNRGVVKFVDHSKIEIVNNNFTWVSMYQIKQLLNLDAIINPHLARLIFL
jgi:dTDP-4-dehydro-6-deoxy-alpha-D-glucopyranose 2,3-dehydratase